MDASRGTQKVLNSLLPHQCDVLQACQRGRNTYLAGGVEVTTFTNVDTTVTAGSVDTDITVEVTWEGASSAKGHIILASDLVGSRCKYEGSETTDLHHPIEQGLQTRIHAFLFIFVSVR